MKRSDDEGRIRLSGRRPVSRAPRARDTRGRMSKTKKLDNLEAASVAEPFDAGKYFECLEALSAPLQISPEDFPRYDAEFRIRDFVSCFSFENGLATDTSIYPSHAQLKWLAERFDAYRRGKGSLDEAFGLTGGGRGRRSARSKMAMRDRQIRAIVVFAESRKHGRSVDQAIAEVSQVLNCSESLAHSLVYRDRVQPQQGTTVRKAKKRTVK